MFLFDKICLIRCDRGVVTIKGEIVCSFFGSLSSNSVTLKVFLIVNRLYDLIISFAFSTFCAVFAD